MPDLPPMTPPVKRSVTIGGHRTSVSLEDAFWKELRGIARARGQTAASLIAERAGCRVTDRSGRTFGFNSLSAQGNGLIVAGPRLHAALAAAIITEDAAIP